MLLCLCSSLKCSAFLWSSKKMIFMWDCHYKISWGFQVNNAEAILPLSEIFEVHGLQCKWANTLLSSLVFSLIAFSDFKEQWVVSGPSAFSKQGCCPTVYMTIFSIYAKHKHKHWQRPLGVMVIGGFSPSLLPQFTNMLLLLEI